MRFARTLAVCSLPALAAACGGGSSPTDPATPPPPSGTPVSGFVFYDENGNGVADAAETVRLPAVTVTVGGQSGQSGTGGRFTVGNVPAGVQAASVRGDSLPAYFEAGTAVSVTAPQSAGDVGVPAVLKLGGRARPNFYLAFGDSITSGDGSSDGYGYVDDLAADLRAYWGRADLAADGAPGTKSNKGESRLGASLVKHRPAYLLILYGTNDWNDGECRDWPPCYTVEALRSMILQARDAGAHPVVGTIPPVNPAYADKGAEARNDWVRRMNDLVRAMAKQERASVAEVHGDFLKQASLRSLFADDKHPNDAGYRVISRSFFDAITRPLAATASGRAPAFFLAPAGND